MNAETLSNPYRLMLFTNDPADPAPPANPSWILASIFIMKFHPGLNPDLLSPKLYGLFFWRPEPPKQGVLL